MDARPQPDSREMRTLDGDDLDRFLGVIRGDRLEAMWVTAVREGPRQGELLAMHWQDVDLDAGTMSVTGSLQANQIIGTPKSRRGRRLLALFPETIVSLREHRARQAEERLSAGNQWADLDLVFCTEFGTYLNPATLTRALHRILRKAGLPDLRFHDLRHTAATSWLRDGLHPKIASDRLGHASVAITFDLYSHVSPGLQREAIEQITRRRTAR